MGYNSIAWLPLCAGLTVLGLVLSYLVGRRRGRLSMVRGVAWSLLPLAAYLTGSVEMFWKIGAAIGHYADGFVFSPVKWAGIAVAGLSAVLFFTTSGRRRRKTARSARQAGPGQSEAGTGTAPGAVTAGAAGDLDITRILREAGHPGQSRSAAKTPASASGTPATPAAKSRSPEPRKPQKQSRSAPDDTDDMKDIEDILRKRGI